jgi:triacylglycerol lipase
MRSARITLVIPIVMHHGLFGFGNIKAGPIEFSYFHGIDRALAQRGHRVIVSRVHPTAGIERRARQLKESILKHLPFLAPHGEKLLLIAHSLGGLDARFMLANLDMARHVDALLTITAPHRGSSYADYWMHHLGHRLGGLHLVKLLGLDVQALSDLTTDSCRQFNQTVPDVPGVRYYSISAACPRQQVPHFAIHSHRIVAKAEGDNDGMVSVQSSTWGEHLGVWSVDHFHTINRHFAMNPPIKDIAPLYVEAVERIYRA